MKFDGKFTDFKFYEWADLDLPKVPSSVKIDASMPPSMFVTSTAMPSWEYFEVPSGMPIAVDQPLTPPKPQAPEPMNLDYKRKIALED